MCDSVKQMYCKGLFAMIDYFQFSEIYRLSIARQKFNYKVFFEKYFQCNSMKHDAR